MFSCKSGLGAHYQASGLHAVCSAKLYSSGSLLCSCCLSPAPSPAVSGSRGGQLGQPPRCPRVPLAQLPAF